ncbi:type II toxin-antitoxin system RelE/ParE family toxin [Bacteroidota bacterium]
MPSYKLTNKAVEDLSDIWNYTFDNWSEKQADKYYKILLDHFAEISENQKIGKNYNGITNHLFGFKTGRHIIFYRILDKDFVEITRILHEKMDLKNRIND